MTKKMKRFESDIYIEETSLHEFIQEIVKLGQQYEDFENVFVKTYDGVIQLAITYERLETDVEYEARLVRSERGRKAAEKRKLGGREEALKEFKALQKQSELLQKKYGFTE